MNPLVVYFLIFWFGIWAICWDRSDARNQIIKLIFTVLAIWGAYLVYNPGVSPKYFLISLTIESIYFGFNWTRKNVLNFFLKVIHYAIAGYGLVVIFSTHMFG